MHAVHRAWQPRGAVHPFRAPRLSPRSLSRDEYKKEKKEKPNVKRGEKEKRNRTVTVPPQR